MAMSERQPDTGSEIVVSRHPSGLEALFLSTKSPFLRRALDRARRFGSSDDCLLIEGETGTGKTSLAAFVHSISPRRNERFVEVSLAGLNDELASCDLFGCKRGAFTGAVKDRKGLARQADGGTLFLDEVGKSSLAVQQRILELVESGRILPVGADRHIAVDCRIIAASNVSLEDLVAREEFLPDLRHRMDALRLRLPALRERAEDIPDIVEWMIAKRVREDRVLRETPRLHPEFLGLFAADPWPGNLRELANVVGRIVLMADRDPELTPAHFFAERFGEKPTQSGLTQRRKIELRACVAEHGGNITKAALYLGMHRTTLHRHLREAD